jgi:hypothetical protein
MTGSSFHEPSAEQVNAIVNLGIAYNELGSEGGQLHGEQISQVEMAKKLS